MTDMNNPKKKTLWDEFRDHCSRHNALSRDIFGKYYYEKMIPMHRLEKKHSRGHRTP